VSTLSTFIQYSARILSQNNKANKRSKSDTNSKGKVQIFLFSDNVILYLEDPKDSTKTTWISKTHLQRSKLKNHHTKK
jgi:hypothetical protein